MYTDKLAYTILTIWKCIGFLFTLRFQRAYDVLSGILRSNYSVRQVPKMSKPSVYDWNSPITTTVDLRWINYLLLFRLGYHMWKKTNRTSLCFLVIYTYKNMNSHLFLTVIFFLKTTRFYLLTSVDVFYWLFFLPCCPFQIFIYRFWWRDLSY